MGQRVGYKKHYEDDDYEDYENYGNRKSRREYRGEYGSRYM